MNQDPVVVATYRGVEIYYGPEKKQFIARVGGRDIQKPTQHAIEKVILKYQGACEPKKVMHVKDNYWAIEVRELTAVGAKGSKVLFKRPGRDEIDREDGDEIYVFDEKLFAQAKEMAKEREDWKKRWSDLIGKMKRVDLEELK